jgi:hypothetical protein
MTEHSGMAQQPIQPTHHTQPTQQNLNPSSKNPTRTNDVKRVLAGFARLLPPEQEEVGREINRFLHANNSEKQRLKFEWVDRMVLGPLVEACPCCGR